MGHKEREKGFQVLYDELNFENLTLFILILIIAKTNRENFILFCFNFIDLKKKNFLHK